MIQVAYPYVLYIGVPVLLALAYWRWVYYKQPVYQYSSLLPLSNLVSAGKLHTIIPFILRFLVLASLLIALARPRKPDTRSEIAVEGVDIMLVLDVSGSMRLLDDRSDNRTRLDIARDEAINFIKKRTNDPIGLVLFGQVAVTRCPLTLDKIMLEKILRETRLGVIPADETVLSTGIIVATNRLKSSKAISRIMIVLTDGVPSGNDASYKDAIELAKKLDIKIYTVGIGSPDGGWDFDPFFGWQQVGGRQYSEKLLRLIAQETGGQFFKASNPLEMAEIYDTIDTLEKSEHEMPVYSRYFEYFVYFLLAALLLLFLELLVTTLVWVRL